MRRLFIIGGICCLVNACGLPPAVSIASYVVDSLLLVTGGKSSTDHALSLVSAKDCAMWRVVQGRSVCRPPVTDEAAAEADQSDRAQSDRSQQVQSDPVQSSIGRADIGVGRIFPPRLPVDQHPDGVHVAGAEPALQPFEDHSGHAADQPARPSSLLLTTHSGATNDGLLDNQTTSRPPERVMSLCIGSFQDKERAQRWRHRFEDQDARIVRAVVDGQLWHRVLLSPPKGESTAAFAVRFEQEMGLPFWLTVAVHNKTG